MRTVSRYFGGMKEDATVDVVKMEPVIYTKTGESAGPEPGANLSVSV